MLTGFRITECWLVGRQEQLDPKSTGTVISEMYRSTNISHIVSNIYNKSLLRRASLVKNCLIEDIIKY